MNATVTTAPPRPAGASILGRTRELCQWLARRRVGTDEFGEVPAEMIERLRDAGCLQMVVPAIHGGADLTLPETIAVIEELSHADGTLGWLIGQVTLAHLVIAYYPPATAAEVYADGPDVYVAGAAAAKGRAVRGDGDWRVSGRWPLVSGITHARWLYLQCIVTRDGEIPAQSDEIPEMRTALVPRSDVRVLRTYAGLGLEGSGSHDAQLKGARCPAARMCDLLGAPQTPSAASRIPVRTQAGLVAAAFMIGTASAALDAITTLAISKRPAFSTRRLADQARFQESLGDAEATLAAARSLLHEQLTAADARAAAGEPVTVAEEAVLRAVGPQVSELAGRVVDLAYGLGGSTAVADVSPLQRRLRDARTISQHATLSADFYGPVGAAALAATELAR